jgi:hypothetical protein
MNSAPDDSSESRTTIRGCYWKYPLISRIRWLKLVVYAVTSPLAPAGTRAAFDTIVPSREFSVETKGFAPLPHNVRKLRDPGGTTVAFSEYAFAVEGMPQVDDGTGKLRDSAAPIIGPPNGPAGLRVSRMRHGVAV